jgi:hypothetical protein
MNKIKQLIALLDHFHDVVRSKWLHKVQYGLWDNLLFGLFRSLRIIAIVEKKTQHVKVQTSVLKLFATRGRTMAYSGHGLVRILSRIGADQDENTDLRG